MKRFIIAGGLVCCFSFQTWSQVALIPDNPALTPSPVFVPSSPALATPVATSGVVATNATLLALSDSLRLLQNNLQQTLPVLSLFNDNFDFVSLADNGSASTSAGVPAAPGNFATNLGTNFARNLGVNAAMPTGSSLFNTAPAATTTTTSAAGLPQGASSVPATRDALRALLVLQSDIERMLPLVNALNGGTSNSPGSFTNLFGLVPVVR